MPDPRHLIPDVGFYMMTLVKSGIEVPVSVWETGERDPDTGEPLEDVILHVKVNNVEFSLESVDSVLEQIALFAKSITERRYLYMVDDLVWEQKYERRGPKANPYRPIDLTKVKSLF